MKKGILLNILLFVAATAVFGQKKTTTTPAKTQPSTQTSTTQTKPQQESDKLTEADEKIISHFVTKYSLATRWNDEEMAKSTLYDLIVQYPGSDSLIFVLALNYFEHQKYPSSILIGQDLLQRNPKNLEALELVGLSFEALNIPDKALQNFETLYLATNRVETLYKMSFLQYSSKKYAEALLNTDILLAKPEAESLKMTFTDQKNAQKQYSMKVPLLNLKGMIYKEQGDKVNAKKFFEQAIAAAPDFQPAKENLAALAK